MLTEAGLSGSIQNSLPLLQVSFNRGTSIDSIDLQVLKVDTGAYTVVESHKFIRANPFHPEAEGVISYEANLHDGIMVSMQHLLIRFKESGKLHV
jgi:hypothetical protein